MPRKKKKLEGERLFFAVATVFALVLGTGLFFLLYALNQREKTPIFTPETDGAAAIAPDHPRQLVDFSLTDRTGRTVTQADLADKFLVVDFLFTSCSLTCPVVNQRMAEIQRLTAAQPDVKLVSITVDPRDDTVDTLAKYGARFGADTNRWLLLTGDRDGLYHLIGGSFLAQDASDSFNYMPGNFTHTERIAVVDNRGHVRAYFDGLNDGVAQAVVDQIARLRN